MEAIGRKVLRVVMSTRGESSTQVLLYLTFPISSSYLLLLSSPLSSSCALLPTSRVLLRVRMLYYLKQEVIGGQAEAVLKGGDYR